MAAIGMEMIAQWGGTAISARLAALTTRLAEGLEETAVSFPEMRFRAPHILSISFPGGVPGGFVEALAAEEVYVARRLGRLRISPHVYNDEADIERFIEVFHRFVRQHWVQPMECRAVRS